MDTKNDFGLKIKKARERAKLTQNELATKAKTSSQTVSNCERGTRYPPLETAIYFAKALGVSLDWLTDNMGTYNPANIHELSDVATLIEAISDVMPIETIPSSVDGFSNFESLCDADSLKLNQKWYYDQNAEENVDIPHDKKEGILIWIENKDLKNYCEKRYQLCQLVQQGVLRPEIYKEQINEHIKTLEYPVLSADDADET